MQDYKDQDEIYSNRVRAGKRTYFFDVRATKSDDYYLTITESKKTFEEDGGFSFKKHKVFLYKEDFAKFKEALIDCIDFIIKEKGEEVIHSPKNRNKSDKNSFTDINFEDI